MRFIEFTSPVSDLRCWATRASGYSFVISLDSTLDDPEFAGYTASWKNLKADMLPFGSQPANRIDGGPWPSFTAAEQACRQTLKRLLQKN